VNLASIPPQAAFLDSLAEAWLRDRADPSDGLILLPTRRAARALAEAFLRASNGRPMLLPRITALGAIDEAPLALAGALDLPPAIEPAARNAALAKLILALPAERGGARTLDAAWMLARDLAALMDEAERAEIDLRAALRAASPEAFAEHWQITLQFLSIVTDIWPAHLEAQGVMNPAARQAALLAAQAEAWEAGIPHGTVWAAGMTGATPAVARLLKAIARHGQVILPGLDLAMPQDAWEQILPSHPQHGMARLLAGLGATRGDVTEWPATAHPRPALLARALWPAEALKNWTDGHTVPDDSLRILEPADQQEEAAAIAMILRDAVETPGTSAALVTPDRALALRVATELRRWDVVADDSAGEDLAQTPPAVFLRLLAATLADQLGPVTLLALLKHPLAAAGMPPADCRTAARTLERAALRGPRPADGFTGLRRAAAEAHADVKAFVERIRDCLEPALHGIAGVEVAPEALLAGLIEAAERLAASDDTPGPARLWALEEGEALATALAAALPALQGLPAQPPAILPGLLDALLEGVAVRTSRALRAGGDAEHPRVFIWGLLEARLQSADVMVLGGLAEGVWPRASDPGPWMSRPMRQQAGLPDPEEAIGQAAHDFVGAACAAREVVLSCPQRRDGAPSVPARWLTRLRACLRGAGTAPLAHTAAAWAAALDQPAGPPRPVAPPRPTPARELRPRRLSVTEIETWIADPYSIHARHILRLRKLDPLEQATDASDYGIIVHEALRRFFATHGLAWPADAAIQLRAAMEHVLNAAALRPALRAWWRPRLNRIADWIAEIEADRRADGAPLALFPEIRGEWDVPGVPGGFLLIGKADRIERTAAGGIAILDYKTGTPPANSAVEALIAPQLPLEAAMVQGRGFGPALHGDVVELTYWHVSGGAEPGKVQTAFRGDAGRTRAASELAEVRLRERIIAFDDPAMPYLARPHPRFAQRFPDYAQLARVAEWDLAGGEE
jgi:ATP-dependent helicase/nuclease subunit B